MMPVNQYIDHTLLKPEATESAIRQLCSEAREQQFFSVCVNSAYVPLAVRELEGSSIKVCTVVGFPLGASSCQSKVFEASKAIQDGASEIDMVLNLGQLKSGNLEAVEGEIRKIKQAVGGKILKVILETCYLNDEEIQQASLLALSAQADYMKTSTGFGSRGASENDILLMKAAVQQKAKIKASGGIRDLHTALRYIELGVDRIGTSSGVAIMKEWTETAT